VERCFCDPDENKISKEIRKRCRAIRAGKHTSESQAHPIPVSRIPENLMKIIHAPFPTENVKLETDSLQSHFSASVLFWNPGARLEKPSPRLAASSRATGATFPNAPGRFFPASRTVAGERTCGFQRTGLIPRF
jgi:hypothetical protein